MMEFELTEAAPAEETLHDFVRANLAALLAADRTFCVVSPCDLLIDGCGHPPDFAIYPRNGEVSDAPLAMIGLWAEVAGKETVFKHFCRKIRSYWMVLPESGTVRVYSGPKNCQTFCCGEILEDRVLDVSLNVDDIFS